MWRLISTLTGSPSVPSLRLPLGQRLLGVEPLRVADGELERRPLGQRDQLVGLVERERDRLLQQHVLAGLEGGLGDRVVGRLRRGRDHHRLDVGVGHQLLPVVGGGGRVGLACHLGQPLRLDLGQVERPHERALGGGDGADATAPTRSDHGYIDLTHRTLLVLVNSHSALRDRREASPARPVAPRDPSPWSASGCGARRRRWRAVSGVR